MNLCPPMRLVIRAHVLPADSHVDLFGVCWDIYFHVSSSVTTALRKGELTMWSSNSRS